MNRRVEELKSYIEKVLNERFGIYYRKAPVRVRTENCQERYHR